MKRTRACAGILLAVLWLLVVMQASARRVDFGRSYSLGAHGGVRDKEHWNAGMQALTLHGPCFLHRRTFRCKTVVECRV